MSKFEPHMKSLRHIVPGGFISLMAWVLTCKNAGAMPEDMHGHSVNPLLSAYRPPPVIADIAVDVAGRGTYNDSSFKDEGTKALAAIHSPKAKAEKFITLQ